MWKQQLEKQTPPNKERKQEEWGGSPDGEKKISGNYRSGGAALRILPWETELA